MRIFGLTNSMVVMHNGVLVKAWFHAVDVVIQIINIQMTSLNINKFVNLAFLNGLIEILKRMVFQILHIAYILRFTVRAICVTWVYLIIF